MTATPSFPIDATLCDLLISFLQLAENSRDKLLAYLGELPPRSTGPHDISPPIQGVSAYLGSHLYNRPAPELDIVQVKRSRRNIALNTIPERLAWWISCDFVERALTVESPDGPIHSAIRARRAWIMGDIDDKALKNSLSSVRPGEHDYWAAYAVHQESPASVADHAAIAFDNEHQAREVDWQVSRIIELLRAHRPQ